MLKNYAIKQKDSLQGEIRPKEGYIESSPDRL